MGVPLPPGGALLPADGDAGLILLLCDAPFIESDHPALLLRSGRRTWTAGQVLYIAGTSAVYFAVVYLLTVLVLLPHVALSQAGAR